MSEEPRNLVLERLNRLSQAMADLMDSHAMQGRMLARAIGRMEQRLGDIEARLGGVEANLTVLAGDVRTLASEQILLGNRVEDAFARATRAHARLDEKEELPG